MLLYVTELLIAPGRAVSPLGLSIVLRVVGCGVSPLRLLIVLRIADNPYVFIYVVLYVIFSGTQ